MLNAGDVRHYTFCSPSEKAIFLFLYTEFAIARFQPIIGNMHMHDAGAHPRGGGLGGAIRYTLKFMFIKREYY